MRCSSLATTTSMRRCTRARLSFSRAANPNHPACKTTTARKPEEKHGVELRLTLLRDAAFTQFIVARARGVVAEDVVRLGKVLKLGMSFGVICQWAKCNSADVSFVLGN